MYKIWSGMKKGVDNLLIAICDDEPTLCNSLKNHLYDYFNHHNIDAVIETYLNGESLVCSNLKFDLVFLDYQMPGIDGLQTAKLLRKQNNFCTILFLTNYPEIVFDTFEYNTFRFLIKPINIEKLTEALDSFRQKLDFYYPITLSCDGETYKINTKDIIYIEADGKNSIIRLTDHSFYYHKTMGSVLSVLPKNCFYKTHRAFVVNFAYIDKYNKETIRFTNGEYAKISRNTFVSFKKALSSYLRDITI